MVAYGHGRKGLSLRGDFCGSTEPNAGNGADFESYSWAQTLADVSLTVPLLKGVKGRECDVRITKDKLRVRR